MNICDYKKIMLVGSSGAGKSYLSRKIAELTGYPLFHLDREFLLPNWEGMPKDEQIAKVKEMMGNEQWVIDGNWGGGREARFASADLVIFLDVNRWVCLWSAIRRLSKDRPDIPDFLNEKKQSMFSKDFRQFAKLILSYNKSGRGKILALQEKYLNTPFLHIKSRRSARRILKEWGASK